MATNPRPFNSVGGFSVSESANLIVSSTGNITANFATFVGNVSISNTNSSYGLLTDKLYYSNGVQWTFITAGGSNTQIQFNNNSALGGSGNFTYDYLTSNLSLTGNALFNGNISSTGQMTSDGNITAPYFIGNVQGNISGNIVVPGNNTAVLFNNAGNAGASDAFTFNQSTNVATLNGNLTTNNANLGNLVVANFFTGTLTTAAQPNITSVGTLASLTVTANANSGNVYTGNLSLSGQVISSIIPSNDSTYDIGNSTYYWRNGYFDVLNFSSTSSLSAIGNILQFDGANAANNISAGSITSRGNATIEGNAVISGNLMVSGTTTYINVSELSVNDPVISLGGGNSGANAANPNDGKDRGLWLRTYVDGTGPINRFIGWDNSNAEFALGSDVTNTNDVFTFNSFGNIRGNVALFTTLSGTLSTAAQPNITSVGTLANLSVTGNTSTGNANIATRLIASNLSYPVSDGSSGQVLGTYGNGVLYWTSVSTSSISNGTSNVDIATLNGNVTIGVGGTAGVVTASSSGVNVSGYMTTTGNIRVGTSANSANLIMGNSIFRSVTVNTAAITSNALVTLSGATFTAAEFFIKGYDATGGKYSVATISAVKDATTVDWATYGTLNIGGSTGTFSLAMAGGLMTLSVTPSSSNDTMWTVQVRTV